MLSRQITSNFYKSHKCSASLSLHILSVIIYLTRGEIFLSTKMVLLGKVKVLPVEEIFNGKQESKLVVDVRRNFQNSNGDYESDVMSVFLWRGIAEYIKDVLKIGEDIHIIGRYEVHDGRIILFGEQVDLIR